MKIAILGVGAYAIALAKVFNKNENNEVVMWAKFKEEAKVVMENRENTGVLPGVKIPDRIKITMKYMISLHFVIVRKLNIVWPMLEIDLSFFNFSNFEWYEDINVRIVDMITLPTQEIKTLGRVDKKLNFPFDS